MSIAGLGEVMVRFYCRGVLPNYAADRISALLRDGNLDGARAVDEEHRVPCGFDLTDLIYEACQSKIGEDVEVICPKCGNVVHVKFRLSVST